MVKKVLILDGISGVPLATEITEAFRELTIATDYIDSSKLKRRKFNKITSAVQKLIHRYILKEDYYRHPKMANQNIQQVIAGSQPDIVFVIGFLYRFFDLEFFKQLKDRHEFKLYLYDTDSGNLFNNKRELLYFFNRELPIYDHIFSFSKTTTEFINKLNSVEATFFPYGAKQIPKQDVKVKQHDVLFVGSADMRRVFLLEHLTQQNLCVYGSKWQRNGDVISTELNSVIHDQSIWGDELHQLLATSKIILNITRSTFYGVETGLNLRIFETLAAGGFLLTDHCEELEELFIIGKHIETYKNAKELKEKVEYYLTHEDERAAIARSGYEFYMKNYAWKSRMEKLLQLF